MPSNADPPNSSTDTKLSFLKDDLYDALRWLFVSAVTWEAMREKPDLCTANQDAISMLASLTQSRALYEFFFANNSKGDDARASHFAPLWKPAQTSLYTTYMAPGKPTNKRVSHLVYNRSAHSGGSAANESDHLKNQVLKIAKDIRDLTEQFGNMADANFRDLIRAALESALEQARFTADRYGIDNPV